MFYNFYNRLTNINLSAWVAAYVGLIAIYTQLPEAVWVVRPVMSGIAQIMIAVILVAAFEKVRNA